MFHILGNKSSFNEKDAQIIIKQLAQGLEYLHIRGLAHKDINQMSIQITDERTLSIKITNYEITPLIEGNKDNKLQTWSVMYLAPEILKGESGLKSDEWSIGVLLYIILCGKPPFKGNSYSEVMASICQGKYEFKDKIWNRISHEVKDLIKKLLTYD